MSTKQSLSTVVPVLLVLVLALSAVQCTPSTPAASEIEAAQATASAAEAALAAAVASGAEDVAAAQATAQAAMAQLEAAEVEAEAAGDELVIAVPAENVSLASWQAQVEINSPGLRNVFEQLVDRDPVTNELVPELATSWEQIDPARWRFYLREGVTFHDGSPFNAESAAFGINWTWDPEYDFNTRIFMGSQITAEAVDEYTVDVLTEEPDPIIPARMYFTPLPSMQAILDSPDSYPVNPVGTGPYRFAEWKRGQEILYVANPDWWGHDSPDARGAVTFDRVRFVFRPEDSVRAAMVQSGEADIALFITAEQCAAIEAASGVHCESVPSTETLFMRYDTPCPVLADVRIREAIGLAVDNDLIVDQILGGIGTPAAMLVGPSCLGWNPDIEPSSYDLDTARELVAAARDDGVPVDGTTLIVNVRQASIPRIAEVAQAVQAMLTEAGLSVDLQIQEASIFNPEFGEKPTPERCYITIHPHGNEMFDYGYTLNGYYRSGSTASGVIDTVLDDMITEAWTLAGQDREEAFLEIAAYIDERFYTGHIAHLDLAYGLSDRVSWRIPLDHRLLVKDMSLND